MVMKKTIVAGILLVAFASLGFAQDHAPAVSARGGCGPSAGQFDVKADRKQHPVASPDAGKALAYVFEDIERGPTMRVGVEGAWSGANKGNSYFFFSVDPGDHQVCTNWQSGTFKETSKRIGSATTIKVRPKEARFITCGSRSMNEASRTAM